METQMFGGFIQERELRKQGAKGEQEEPLLQGGGGLLKQEILEEFNQTFIVG